MNKNPATELRIKIEDIAAKLHESYIELNQIYAEICKIEQVLIDSP